MTAAQKEANDAGRPQSVYRFRAWSAGVYGVRSKDRLPSDAEIAATYEPTAAAPPAAPAEGMLF